MDDKAQPFPNIETITFGYNIYKASPLARVDEGYAGKVFELDWDNVKRHSSGKYFPKDLVIR